MYGLPFHVTSSAMSMRFRMAMSCSNRLARSQSSERYGQRARRDTHVYPNLIPARGAVVGEKQRRDSRHVAPSTKVRHPGFVAGRGQLAPANRPCRVPVEQTIEPSHAGEPTGINEDRGYQVDFFAASSNELSHIRPSRLRRALAEKAIVASKCRHERLILIYGLRRVIGISKDNVGKMLCVTSRRASDGGYVDRTTLTSSRYHLQKQLERSLGSSSISIRHAVKLPIGSTMV